jgi:hypothetical protein
LRDYAEEGEDQNDDQYGPKAHLVNLQEFSESTVFRPRGGGLTTALEYAEERQDERHDDDNPDDIEDAVHVALQLVGTLPLATRIQRACSGGLKLLRSTAPLVLKTFRDRNWEFPLSRPKLA